jgi:serralysin
MSTSSADTIRGDVLTTSSIAPNTVRSGFINSTADQDFFRINLVAGQSYIFDVDGISLSDPTLTLRNSAGTQLVFNDDGGPGLDSRIQFRAPTSGTFFLDVGGFNTSTGSYNLKARIDDVADDIETTNTIGLDFQVAAVINSAADQDFFRVNLQAGRTYSFDVDGIGLSDTTLALRNSLGTQLVFDDDGGPGLDSHIQFRAPTSGTFFLDVGGFGSNTGSYLLDIDLIA